MLDRYDVIVVGAGHAGCEAANAAAKLGSSVLLVTMNMNTIAHMSCNPAMGGIAKGQIIREIDALGGMSGIITDESMIQYRMLNRSKGPAMWSPRSQNDRMLFAEKWRLALEQNSNVDFWQEMVTGLLTDGQQVIGVKTALGIEIKSKTVVLTNGTFLNGLIHIGNKNFGGGRTGERSSTGITEELENIGFESGRMKTGTPPRVDGRSLDYSQMEKQEGDEHPGKFSFSNQTTPLSNQRSCYITYTNPTVHDILAKDFDKSPMFNGSIQGVGPRYCPSIEDKINRFSERGRHQIFVEPEGWNTVEVYVNGFSTSLPESTQQKAIRQIPGFEKAKLFRPGYAIEYDYFPPTQLNNTLETKLISGLFFAGQINGTTGYEEAGCQGLIAGINAHLKHKNEEPFTLSRSEAYIGVLIDDLINKGTEEPYRMFTSRAEFRILLRQDNADLRLTPKGHALGLASNERLQKVEAKHSEVDQFKKHLEKTRPSVDTANDLLTDLKETPIKEKTTLSKLLKRPGISIKDLQNLYTDYQTEMLDNEILKQVEIQIKYETYITKEQELADKIGTLEDLKIYDTLDYEKIPALSAEAREKLQLVKPQTLGQANRISGVSPADISILTVYLRR
ncbi:MAG: tRNA uridine-5-carboxymethylaminomethyl(34) synthesis enzyme MnmG [Bacteroidota bacterium]